jgi:hypothetical protein
VRSDPLDETPPAEGRKVGAPGSTSRLGPAGLMGLRSMPPLRLAWFAGGGLGWGLFAAFLVVGTQTGRFEWPGGDLRIYIAAGDALRAGQPVFSGAFGTAANGFFYAPPLALACAALSWLPATLLAVAVAVLEIGSLRYMAGSWIGAGIVAGIPVTPLAIGSGNLNLVIGAAILAAQRGHAWPLALATLAKIGPLAALPPRHWRSFVVAAGVACAISLPWAYLWRDWLDALLAVGPSPGWPNLVPLVWRLPFVLGLVLLRRPWARAAAGILALPGLYIWTLLLFVAPLRLWLEERRAVSGGDPSPAVGRG